MDWTSIIIAVITAISAGVGVYFSNRKSASLIEYRMEQLEQKVDTHNRFGDRIVLLEQFEVLQKERNKQVQADLQEVFKKCDELEGRS